MSENKKITLSPENVEVMFRNKAVPGIKGVVRMTLTDLVHHGLPTGDSGETLPATTAKIHADGSIIFVSSMDDVDVHYVDGTSQSLRGFLSEVDGTDIKEVTYFDRVDDVELEDEEEEFSEY